MVYAVNYKGTAIIDYSSLSLDFAEGAFQDFKIGKPSYRDTTEEYELVVGKVKKVVTRYRELFLPLQETHTPFRHLNIRVRAFNDGLAFRYEYPVQQRWSSWELKEENSQFRLHGDPRAQLLLLPSFTTSHEGFYTKSLVSEIREDTLIDMPALFEFPNGNFAAITEAALSNYAGMYLVRKADALVSRLSPLPNKPGIKAKITLPHHSPWRVIMLGDHIGSLIESNILTSLNEPSKIKDVSWIKPGKTTFPWWNGNITPDTSFAPGNNFETNKYYIDFCARNGLEYHSVVEYGLHQWYVDDGIPFEPGPHSDVTRAVPGLDIQQICDYAKTKGVGIRFWIHWKALYPKLDTAFALYEKWGIRGMMVDFMDRDDQEMVNIQEEILRKAAEHHLHIQFHGAYKPTGMHRTYPNEFTREGTLNYETNKWNEEGLSPNHDLDIVFTRMLAGPADYHLGGFRAVLPSQFKTQFTRPLMIGTRCHMLAMYVVLENYQGMVCDYPAAYEGQPGFDFIKRVPTTWDETRVLDARLGEYVIIARRKGDTWYVGAITNDRAREVSIPFAFLPTGKHTVSLYRDQSDENPNSLTNELRKINNQEVLMVRLAAGGGTALIIEKD